ncbi:MAG: hypothetical protein BGP08_18855 [Rhizobiales bacterium 64-17]|nr:MAG: hypothetical protein BGP08_18855 [Rhizobiales bacterium 64-17]
MLTFGYALGALTAALAALAFFLETNNLLALASVFFVAGLYSAVQEALEATVTADMVNADTLTMSYGALGTVNGMAKFVSSAAVGLLWTTVSPILAFGVAACLMTAGAITLGKSR